MEKKKIKITESKLVDLITNYILENKREGWGYEEINNLGDDLSDDEDIHLSDITGDLKGEVVSKKEYLKRMLMDAVHKKDWNKVEWAIMYINHKMK